MTHIQRLQNQMKQYAGENVKVEKITGNYYVFGSELATLRIFKKYKDCTNVNQGFSENLNTYYFSIKK